MSTSNTTCPTCNGVGSCQVGKGGSMPCPKCGGSGHEHTATIDEITYTISIARDRRRKAHLI